MTDVSKVAFLGLGTMGLPMSANLAKAGLTVHGFDPNKGAETKLRARGGHVGFASAGEAAADVQAVITSLPHSAALDQVLTAPDGILALATPPAYVVDMSTIAPSETRRLAERAAEHGTRLVDAPVSGSSVGAADGTLTIMVGAEQDSFDVLAPVLRHLGTNVTHVGPVGAGESIKLINNLLAAINVAAVAEAHSIAAKADMDMRVLYDVISTATGNSWAFRNRMPEKGLVPGSPAENDYAPGFAADLMAKDLELIRQMATEVGSPIMLGCLVQQLYSSASANGWGQQDFSVLAKVYRAMSAGESRVSEDTHGGLRYVGNVSRAR